MHKTGITYLDMTWNPGGCGCSKGCDLCWARDKVAGRVGKNIGCEDCENFRVHLHPERFGDPVRRTKPATVGVQFTGELFDPHRHIFDVLSVLDNIRLAPQHTYVFLTQQPKYMARVDWMGDSAEWCRPNWFVGVTARDQGQLERSMEAIKRIPHKIWLSAEPLEGPMILKPYLPRLFGVIVGTNNNAAAPQAQWKWIADIIRQCQRAPVCVYVKQIRTPGGGKKLLTDPAKFPPYFQIRELPWPIAGKPAFRDHHRKHRRPLPPAPTHFERVGE